MKDAERMTADRRLQTLDSQRGFLMRQREQVGQDPGQREAFDQLARRFNDRVILRDRKDLVVPLFNS